MAKRFTAYVHGSDSETGMNTSVPHLVVLASDYEAAQTRIRELEAELEYFRVEGAYQRGLKDAIQRRHSKRWAQNPYPDGSESNRLWNAGFLSVIGESDD